MAADFGKRAEEALASLPDNEARATLRDIVHYVLDRRS
jgi:geranylgeranyl pyrophosphate synthase